MLSPNLGISAGVTRGGNIQGQKLEASLRRGSTQRPKLETSPGVDPRVSMQRQSLEISPNRRRRRENTGISPGVARRESTRNPKPEGNPETKPPEVAIGRHEQRKDPNAPCQRLRESVARESVVELQVAAPAAVPVPAPLRPRGRAAANAKVRKASMLVAVLACFAAVPRGATKHCPTFLRV